MATYIFGVGASYKRTIVKGTFRIGGALIIGILIVLGAFYVQSKNATTEAGGVAVVTEAPERGPIKTTDTDNDGTPDWEESLEARVMKTIETPTSTSDLTLDESYEPPTTFTGKFSEAFFEDYLKGKINGQDFSDPSAFVGTAVKAIEQNTQSKRHTRTELTIIPDSPEAIRTYGNRITEIMKLHSINNENEASILQRALTANDPSILTALAPIRQVYEGTIADSLLVEVPESLALSHVNLLNAYEAILTDIKAMQVAFTDPLYAFARTKEYEKDSEALFNALQNIALVLTREGATYTDDESGTFFYLFDT